MDEFAQEIENAIDGADSLATQYEIYTHCFQQLADIAEAERILAERKARYRGYIETAAINNGGELKRGGWVAKWSEPTETITYPTKNIRKWVEMYAEHPIVAEFVRSCQSTSIRSGSLRITREK